MIAPDTPVLSFLFYLVACTLSILSHSLSTNIFVSINSCFSLTLTFLLCHACGLSVVSTLRLLYYLFGLMRYRCYHPHLPLLSNPSHLFLSLCSISVLRVLVSYEINAILNLRLGYRAVPRRRHREGHHLVSRLKFFIRIRKGLDSIRLFPKT